jgi:hypothetical protein
MLHRIDDRTLDGRVHLQSQLKTLVQKDAY